MIPYKLNNVAHKIKGMLINIGAKSAAEIAFQIETMRKEGGLAYSDKLFQKLMDEYQRVKNFTIK